MLRISHVSFYRDDTDVINIAPSLIGATDWTLMSMLSIITGINGSGKSQLIKYLLNKNKESLYLDPYEKLDLDILSWVVEAANFKMMTDSNKNIYLTDFMRIVCDNKSEEKRFECDDVYNSLFKYIIIEEQKRFDLEYPRGQLELHSDYSMVPNDSPQSWFRRRPEIIDDKILKLARFEIILDKYLQIEFHRNSLAHLVYDHITKPESGILRQFNEDIIKAVSSIRLHTDENNEIVLLSNRVKVYLPEKGLLYLC